VEFIIARCEEEVISLLLSELFPWALLLLLLLLLQLLLLAFSLKNPACVLLNLVAFVAREHLDVSGRAYKNNNKKQLKNK